MFACRGLHTRQRRCNKSLKMNLAQKLYFQHAVLPTTSSHMILCVSCSRRLYMRLVVRRRPALGWEAVLAMMTPGRMSLRCR